MNFLQRQLEDPKGRARIKRWAYLGLGLVVAAETVQVLFFPGHPHFSFESFPAWGSLYGLVSCVVIIVGSKFVGKVWLMRREGYYDS